MATLRQTTTHMVQFGIGRAIFLFVVKFWAPFTDFFRALWWKAWGHDPKSNPEFHLSQIDFSAGPLARSIVISSMALDFISRFYGITQDEAILKSNTLLLLSKRMNFHYLSYDISQELSEIFAEKKPAAKLIEFILKYEGIAIGAFDYRMTNNVSFRQFVETLLVREVPLPA